ncbi:MAG: glycosyltransferase [Cyanobacteria bacterium J06598_1]
MNDVTVSSVGIVAIGRNEGDRLVRCLQSLRTHLPSGVPIVYVDSGSTDGSVAAAKRQGVEVVNLDMSVPFTGARARNAGAERLLNQFPQTQCIQFIDGDCEILSGWVEAATRFLQQHPQHAVVFGRLRERFPQASTYNQLADLEWNVPSGEAEACGGIALMRTAAFKQAGGFNPKLICGEEPELCIRLRRLGWSIQCIATDMALHDIDMHRFGQWWKRSVRGGWAVAQGSDMYGQAAERYKFKAHISGWLWGLALPLGAVLAVRMSHGLSILLLASAYALQVFKIFRARQQRGNTPTESSLYAIFCVLSKVPQAIGQGKYWINRWQNKPAELIEYKGNT